MSALDTLNADIQAAAAKIVATAPSIVQSAEAEAVPAALNLIEQDLAPALCKYLAGKSALLADAFAAVAQLDPGLAALVGQPAATS